MTRKLLALSFSICFAFKAHSQILVKDIKSNGDSRPTPMGDINNKFIFYASDSAHGGEPWVTDGTESGTEMLKDIRPGISGSSFPTYCVKAGQKIYFVASVMSSLHMVLYCTDGTAAGTVQIKDLGYYPIPQGGGTVMPMLMAAFNDNLCFVYDDGTGKELWLSDGTEAGTKMLKEINSSFNSGSNPCGLTVYNNALFFFANDGTHGSELWKTDGTESGTVLVKDIYSGAIGSNTVNYPSMIVFKNKLYFGAQGDHDQGLEPYVTDGTEAGTKLLKNINSNVQGSSYPAFLATSDNLLFFSATTATEGSEPWISDGTEQGTKLLKDVVAGTGGSSVFDAEVINNQFVFPTYTDIGYELWRSDGTTDNTMLLKDIYPGTESGYYGGMKKLGNRLFFIGITEQRGQELWETDGSSSNTLLNKDLNPGTEGSSINFVYPLNGKLFLNAKINGLGDELYTLVPGQGTNINRPQLKTTWGPNPVNPGGILYLKESGLELSLTDMSGRTYRLAESSEGYQIPASLTSGIYSLSINNGIESIHYKLVIAE